MPSIVHAEKLSKRYFLSHRQEDRYATLRDTVAGRVKQACGRLVRRGPDPYTSRGAREEFWALRDISFDLQEGARVGIIGRNGAGKSTLLKILSRITEPTEGWVRIGGRVAALLEVGTGFHPELTGRENIFLNGAILGMSKADIKRRFDEIVAFAEVERFLDTPVKRYSSGMYVRLAFSVAAHLEPEVLVVDEVLAVGDGAFQKKCLGRMSEAGKEGRTILFVSHSMPAVRGLCETAIWLKDGRIAAEGSTEKIIARYLQDISTDAQSRGLAKEIADLPRDRAFRLLDIAILQDSRRTMDVLNGKPVEIEIAYEVYEESIGLHVYFQLFDTEGTMLFESINNGCAEDVPIVKPGAYVSRAVIPENFLSPTRYTLLFWAGIYNVRALFPKPISATIDVQSHGVVNNAYPGYQSPGKLLPLLAWQTTRRDLSQG
jgi:lipopolysaccharide transport system ATP-binding protein